jgi:hypothetical protein
MLYLAEKYATAKLGNLDLIGITLEVVLSIKSFLHIQRAPVFHTIFATIVKSCNATIVLI